MKNTAEIKKENQRRIWEILRDGLPHTKQEAAGSQASALPLVILSLMN